MLYSTFMLTWHELAPIDQENIPPESVFFTGLRHHHIANTAYPIHHAVTMQPYRASADMAEQTAIDDWVGCKRMSLYAHIPFCAARCYYCEYVVVPKEEAEAFEDEYFAALLRELELYRQKIQTDNKTLVGFDIGGGTPSYAKSENIGRLVSAVRQSFRVKPGMTISIETTPIIAAREPEKIRAFRKMGIERISMGIQTTQASLSLAMNREFPGLSVFKQAVNNIRQAGFQRFNIDLMYGFPEQALDSWKATLEHTIALGPEYITLYRVRYKGTRIKEQAAEVTLEEVKNLENIAWGQLKKAGYHCSPGKNTYSHIIRDVGTSDYLTERVIRGTPYLGIGLGAQTMSPHTLSYNLGAATKTMGSYLQAIKENRLPIQDIYHLSKDGAIAKMISVSFYFGQIHRRYFQEKFGVTLEQQFPREIDFVLKHKYMSNVGPYLRLTRKGARHYNGIIALFYAGAVKRYLVDLQHSFATK